MRIGAIKLLYITESSSLDLQMRRRARQKVLLRMLQLRPSSRTQQQQAQRELPHTDAS